MKDERWKIMKDIRRAGGFSLTSYLPHEIELWEIERLTANPKNARKHSTEQIQELAASMSAFGFMSAVVADSDGIVLAGNARLQAARRLGLRRVPVIVADHLSESEKQAFAIADNQIGLHASWDNETLRVQLELLRQEGMDLKLTGFSEQEFSALVDELEANTRLEDEDAAPEPPEVAVTEGVVSLRLRVCPIYGCVQHPPSNPIWLCLQFPAGRRT